MDTPYNDWGVLPEWDDQGPTLGTATGKSITTLGNLYDTYSSLMPGSVGEEYLGSIGRYDAGEESIIRDMLKEDSKSFTAATSGAMQGYDQQSMAAQKKVGKAGLARSGSAMKGLAELRNQYGEDMTSLRKDMEAKRYKAMSDIADKRGDWLEEIQTAYTTWTASKPEDMEPSNYAAAKIKCAEKGGTWINYAGQNRCDR